MEENFRINGLRYSIPYKKLLKSCKKYTKGNVVKADVKLDSVKLIYYPAIYSANSFLINCSHYNFFLKLKTFQILF